MIDVGASLLGSRSWARDINDAGAIVGYAVSEKNGETYPFLWDRGMVADLRTLVTETSGADFRRAMAIDGSGRIAVDAEVGGARRGFLLTETAVRLAGSPRDPIAPGGAEPR